MNCLWPTTSRSGSWKSPWSGNLRLDRIELLLHDLLVERVHVRLDRGVDAAELFLELRSQLLEHGVRLIGWLVVAAFHNPLQRRELVVQSNREVQRVLAAAVAVLVDLAFDVGQLR